MEQSVTSSNPLTISPDWKDAVLHAKRAMKPDFGAGVASDAERAGLPAVGKQAQDYLSWRRSVLEVAFGMLALTATFGMVNFGISVSEQDQQANQFMDLELANLMQFTQVAAKCFLAVMVFLAWKNWQDLPRAHRRVKLGWLVGLLVPFVLALVPVSEILHFRGMAGGEGAGGAERAMVMQVTGLIFGLTYFIQLMPSIISVFVGAIRGALMTTRFLPESAIPGWVAGVAAPVLSLLILAVFVLINQIGGNKLLMAGFVLVILNFLLYARFGPRLARSYSRSELEREFGHLRAQSAMLLGGGAVCIVIALFSTEIMGMRIVGVGEKKLFSVLQLFEILIELVGKSTITMLLFSDLLIAAIRHSRETTQVFQGSELAKALDLRLEELHTAGVQSIAELGRFRTSGKLS